MMGNRDVRIRRAEARPMGNAGDFVRAKAAFADATVIVDQLLASGFGEVSA